MKITLPKEIRALTSAIAGYQAESDRRHADIERAREAFTKAERLTTELHALAERRAQLQAEAFIQRTQVDLSELDAEEQALESASRAARSDGRTAEIAIGMLNKQLEELTAKIEQTNEERLQLALRWLEDRHERATDRYLALLDDLGDVIAEMAAIDGARPRLGDHRNRQAGNWVRAEWKKFDVPVPFGRKVPIGNASSPNYVTPILWRRNPEHSKPELAVLLAQLHDAGVLPLATIDAATNTAAA